METQKTKCWKVKPGLLFLIPTLSMLLITYPGRAQSLYGPLNPPPKGASISYSGTLNDGQIGRTGGKTYTITNVILANTTTVYWSIIENTVMLSMDGPDYTGNEILSFDESLSDLTGGVLTWTGNTSIPISNTAGTGVSYYDPLYSKFVVTVSDLIGLPVNLVSPALSLLSAGTGGAALIPDNTFTLNLRMEMFVSKDGITWTPHLNYYDAEQTPPAAESAYSSFEFGFYWENDPPELVNNTGANVDENDTVMITSSMLSVSDVESDNDELMIIINPGTYNYLPENGVLQLDLSLINAGDTISMRDISENIVSYIHDGSETLTDSFAFSVIDSDTLKLFIDGDSVFFFTFNITPVDDPPSVDMNEGGTIKEDSVLMITSAMLSGSDPESPSDQLTYTIDPASNSEFPKYGLLKLNGIPLSDGGTFTQKDIDDGLLSYDHDGTQTTNDGFVFQLEDEYGHLAANGLTTVFFFSITIQTTNDDPYLTRLLTLNINEGETDVISSAYLAAADEESDPADIHFIFDPNLNFDGPYYGIVQLNGTPINDGEYFTMDDVNNSRVRYVHDGSEGHSDFFIFRITDPEGGIAHDGPYTDFHFNVSVANVNDPPFVSNPVPDQEARAEQAFSFTFSESAFEDPDEGDILSYTASSVSSGTLPTWLQFNSATRTFSGTPQVGDMGELSVVVTAQDQASEEARDTFNIQVLPRVGTEQYDWGYSIYPNPGDGVFYISLENMKIPVTALQVINILGETVYQSVDFSDDEIRINISDEPEGVYFLLIRNELADRYHRLIIKR